MDIDPTFGLLHTACYLLADWEIYHSRGKTLTLLEIRFICSKNMEDVESYM
jgi:hypothetical protein